MCGTTLQCQIHSPVLDFCPVRRGLGRPPALSGPQIKLPAVHRTFDAAFTIRIATNQGALAVRAAVVDGEDGSVDIEKRNLYAVECDELPFAGEKFIGLADSLPAVFCRSRRRWHKPGATDA